MYVENSNSNLSTTADFKTSDDFMKHYYGLWYLAGIIFLFIAIYYLIQANDYLWGTAKIFGREHDPMMTEYVGGDAYNFMIAGAYSTTLTVRALIFTILSSASAIIGKLCHSNLSRSNKIK